MKDISQAIHGMTSSNLLIENQMSQQSNLLVSDQMSIRIIPTSVMKTEMTVGGELVTYIIPDPESSKKKKLPPGFELTSDSKKSPPGFESLPPGFESTPLTLDFALPLGITLVSPFELYASLESIPGFQLIDAKFNLFPEGDLFSDPKMTMTKTKNKNKNEEEGEEEEEYSYPQHLQSVIYQIFT
jgi:hypothetical protein